MSVKCYHCNHVMPTRNNVFGTICDNCKKYIEFERKPKFVLDAEFRFSMIQNKLRSYLAKIINGDKNGY